MDLVTGGTGFVGTHVVRALLARGRAVRCLVRPQSRRANLEGLSVEIAEGDVTDPASLARAIGGVATLYHCAADYRLWARDPGELHRANVEGTDNVLKAAAAARRRAGRLHELGRRAGADRRRVARRRDDSGVPRRQWSATTRRASSTPSAWRNRGRGAGFPVVIVNPSTPVGERDVKPTPTGQMIVDFLNRRLPAYVDTGLNLVDVRDVAQGHLLAAEKGRIGEKYILGNRDMTLKEILETLARLTGLPAPRIRLPHAVPLAAAAAATWAAQLTGRPPRVSLESVRMSQHRMFFDAGKAVRELGLPQTPVEDALGRAVAWFRENGYVRRPERRPLAIVTALPEELQAIGALARDGLAVGASGDGPQNAERGASALCDAVASGGPHRRGGGGGTVPAALRGKPRRVAADRGRRRRRRRVPTRRSSRARSRRERRRRRS